MSGYRPEVADVFRIDGAAFLNRYRLSKEQYRVFNALQECRTAALGACCKRCDKCGHEVTVYCSCRNRHCPKCQGAARAAWLQAREREVLDVEYFHVVFTMPHELSPLALQNRRVVYGMLFRAASETLQTLTRERRERLIVAAEELAGRIGQTAEACEALGVARSTLYRRRQPVTSKPKRRPRPHRALDETEREEVLGALHCERFVDKAPAQVWATLLDEGTYLCSIRTMYRILEEHGEVRERRNQRRHPNYTKPELLAEAPNQVWSWDITKLRGPVKWTYYYLYVILDIFSRYVVGWMLAHRESAALAQRLIAESCRKQDIEPDQLTLHADRGSSMRSKPVGLLLADLGVTKTHSRPYVSNDNPYSESQFKTMKYCPQFPSRFGSAEDGRLFCCGFFDYYNFHHRHSGIGLMTPADVHYGRAEQLTTARRQILIEAQRAHPERFVRGTPQPPVLPPQAWINPPLEKTKLHDAAQAPLAAASIPGVPPFSASRNQILVDVDVDRADLTSLPTIIEAH